MTNFTLKNFFEKIGIFIPGYKGYAEREGRRETDKILRNKFVQILSEKKSVFDEILLILTNTHRLSLLNEIDRVKKKAEKIVDKIKYAEHGASGFFDIVQVKEEELEKLYEFDLSLAESINHISKQIEKVKEVIQIDDKDVKSFINELMDTLNKFDDRLNSRKQCILEVK